MEKNHKEDQHEDDGGEIAGEEEEGDVGSSLTLERVAAAKLYIENHYKSQMKHIQQRKARHVEPRHNKLRHLDPCLMASCHCEA